MVAPAHVQTGGATMSGGSEEEETEGATSAQTPPLLPVQSSCGQELIPPPELGENAL